MKMITLLSSAAVALAVAGFAVAGDARTATADLAKGDNAACQLGAQANAACQSVCPMGTSEASAPVAQGVDPDTGQAPGGAAAAAPETGPAKQVAGESAPATGAACGEGVCSQ